MDLATTHDWREGAAVPPKRSEEASEAGSRADEAAFQSFVERNMRFAFRVAWALLRNRSDVESSSGLKGDAPGNGMPVIRRTTWGSL
jgi:hypothetical protein